MYLFEERSLFKSLIQIIETVVEISMKEIPHLRVQAVPSVSLTTCYRNEKNGTKIIRVGLQALQNLFSFIP